VRVQDGAKAATRFASSLSRNMRRFTRPSRENAQALPTARVARKGW
jgi:hypothetical protein